MNASEAIKSLCIGSRESPLALAQTHYVMGLIQHACPNIALSLKTFKTQGDKFLEAPLSQIGDKGLFVKELEEALLSGDIDLAVHSLKDMLSILPDGLTMQSISPREDARDVLVEISGKKFYDLPAGAVIGTSSLRRVAQLQKLRPDLNYQNVRGNLQTRYRKLKEGHYDALILAAAGIHRMGWLQDTEIQSSIRQYFNVENELLPAVGQGILAVEYKANNHSLQAVLNQFKHDATELAMLAERAFLKELEGGCRLPVAAYARAIDNSTFQITGAVYSLDGTQTLQYQLSFSPNTEDAMQAGKTLAQHLLQHGANEILRQLSY